MIEAQIEDNELEGNYQEHYSEYISEDNNDDQPEDDLTYLTAGCSNRFFIRATYTADS